MKSHDPTTPSSLPHPTHTHTHTHTHTPSPPDPLPIGTTIHIAPKKTFFRISDKILTPQDRLSPQIVPLIAGRSGTVLSPPIYTNKNIELRRVSVLTKDGIILYQNIPIKLLRKEFIQEFNIDENTKYQENEENSLLEKRNTDDNLEARRHILGVLTEVTCRSGKHAVTGKIDSKECELILIGLRNETISKPGKQKTQSVELSVPQERSSPPVPPLLHSETVTEAEIQTEIETETETESTPPFGGVTTAVISDGGGLLDPIGTCLVDNNSIVVTNKDKSNHNEDEKMFSIDSTLIENHPQKARHMDDMDRIDENFEHFSETVKAMLSSSNNHSKNLKEQYRDQNFRSNKIRKNIEKEKQRKISDAMTIIENQDEESYSDLLFLNSIQEANVEGGESLFDASKSITSLSTTTKPISSGSQNHGRRHFAPKSLGSAQRPHFQGNTKNDQTFKAPTPNIVIKVSHLKPHNRVIKVKEHVPAPVLITDDLDDDFDGPQVKTQIPVSVEQRPHSSSASKAEGLLQGSVTTSPQQLLGLDKSYEYMQSYMNLTRDEEGNSNVTYDRIVSPFAQRIIPKCKISITKKPCKPSATAPSVKNTHGSRRGKASKNIKSDAQIEGTIL